MSKIFQKYFKKFPKFPKISKKNQKKFKKIVRKNVKKIFQKCDAEDFGRQKIILMAKSQFFRFFWGTAYPVRGIKFKKFSGPRPYCCKFIKIGYKIFSRRTPVLELPHQIHTHIYIYISII